MFYSWSIAFGVLTCQLLSCSTESITTAMSNYEIVPDVISVAPSEKLQLTYPVGLNVDMGDELTPSEVKYEPSISWPADPHGFYTLCMTDPDFPSRTDHTFREWHHWLVGNIPGHDISRGQTLSEYIGSNPGFGTGLHRYVFLVYKQPSKLNFNEPHLLNKSCEKRANFSIAKFAVKYKLGNPIFGNFFQAQYDEYASQLEDMLECNHELINSMMNEINNKN